MYLLLLKQKIVFLLNIVCILKQLKEVLYNGLDKMPPRDGKEWHYEVSYLFILTCRRRKQKECAILQMKVIAETYVQWCGKISFSRHCSTRHTVFIHSRKCPTSNKCPPPISTHFIGRKS